MASDPSLEAQPRYESLKDLVRVSESGTQTPIYPGNLKTRYAKLEKPLLKNGVLFYWDEVPLIQGDQLHSGKGHDVVDDDEELNPDLDEKPTSVMATMVQKFRALLFCLHMFDDSFQTIIGLKGKLLQILVKSKDRVHREEEEDENLDKC